MSGANVLDVKKTTQQQADFELPPILTEQELADFYRKSLVAVRKARFLGKGPKFLRIGGSIRYRRADVLADLESHEDEPRSRPKKRARVRQK